MNWSAIAFDWNRVRAFLATAEEGSLSAAARALGQTQPTLGRQVAALEEDLGVALFERVGRGYELTPTGLDLLEHVRSMGHAAERISLAVSGRTQAMSGIVTVTASDLYSALLLPEAVARIREAAPGIEIAIVASNALRDLRRREADIALRHLRPTEPELVARHLRDETAHLYAATALLDRMGRPETTEEAAALPFVGLEDPDAMIAHLSTAGLPVTRAALRIHADNGIVAWEMVRAGLGVMPMSDAVAARTDGVERVLPGGFGPVVFPVWLTVHREVRTSRRVRLVYDILAEVFARPAG